MADLRRDISDTSLVAPRDGQLVFLSPLQQGFSREGEVVARILAMDEFEVEAEIPVVHMGFVGAAESIRSFDLEGPDDAAETKSRSAGSKCAYRNTDPCVSALRAMCLPQRGRIIRC
jgi:hypothetical protein